MELTDQLKMERAHGEAQRARLEAILGLTGDAVLMMDERGMPVLTNRAYAELFGLDGFVLVDERGDLLPERETPQWRAARGESFGLSFVVHRADGSRRWCEANGRPLRYVGATHGVVVIRDITECTLRRRQDEFLSLASHHLHAPSDRRAPPRARRRPSPAGTDRPGFPTTCRTPARWPSASRPAACGCGTTRDGPWDGHVPSVERGPLQLWPARVRARHT
jgi:PAS domain S-box-containing protein